MEEDTTEVDPGIITRIVTEMRLSGFDVRSDTTDDGSVAFTCPPRSRLMFGRVIADTLRAEGATAEQVDAMLTDAHTSHERLTRRVTLYFPGYRPAR